ncbi:sec-independent protein translocase protein TatA [Microbacterium natoriense]|uniref:Sec-independent protein translocase protein TatA n=1 Tax=Microbacterium natoriense TaxID=284570 RepID=A0AAW8EZ34_9MICO|nr:twin-arginine translocase TatA/TatE family subunit [Microbacterium natoriense]MDQ0648267.1 sec-independent protein translocase protein TatA [Microbacterium natoriense]
MGNLFAGPHLWIILIIILLLFGAAKLPALAKSMGQSARVFRGEMKAMKAEDAADKADGTPSDTASGTTTSAEAPSTDTPPRSS